MKVSFDIVKLNYPDHEVLGVDEYFKPNYGWTAFVHGRLITASDEPAEKQVEMVFECGATTVQLALKDTKREAIVYADFPIAQLIDQ